MVMQNFPIFGSLGIFLNESGLENDKVFAPDKLSILLELLSGSAKIFSTKIITDNLPISSKISKLPHHGYHYSNKTHLNSFLFKMRLENARNCLRRAKTNKLFDYPSLAGVENFAVSYPVLFALFCIRCQLG